LSQVGFKGVGADARRDRARLELRIAKDLVLRLANQQACQLQQLLIRLGAQTRHEFLGFRFQFRAERLLRRQDALLGRAGEFSGRARILSFVYKNSTNFSAAHTDAPNPADSSCK
jgi:hypothetical protein